MLVNIRYNFSQSAPGSGSETIVNFAELDTVKKELIDNALIEDKQLIIRRKHANSSYTNTGFIATKEGKKWILKLRSGNHAGIQRVPADKTEAALDKMASYAALEQLDTLTLINAAQQGLATEVTRVHAYPA